MGNSLRCCLACVLPCGALDMIRIVHLNGYVEEMTRAVTAGEFLKTYPNHALSKPCSQGMVRKILILSSDSELKRGSIYFLIPNSSLPSDSKPKKSCHDHHHDVIHKPKKSVDDDDDASKCTSVNLIDLPTTYYNKNDHMVVCESKSKSKVGSKHQRRRSSSRCKSGVWQPHLESITEDF